eukprot:PhF_6_TR25873/c0_g1_i2/m.36577
MRAGGINHRQDSLWDAVTQKDMTTVKSLVTKQNVDVNFIAPDGWVREAGGGGRTLLHHAAWVGDLDIFVFLVEHGASMTQPRQRNWARAKGFTPFHHACFYNRAQIVKYCLETGNVDVNMIGEDGFTPLHLAAKFGYVELCKILLEFGARVDIPNKQQKCAGELATKDEVIELFKPMGLVQRKGSDGGVMMLGRRDSTLSGKQQQGISLPDIGNGAVSQPPKKPTVCLIHPTRRNSSVIR